MLTKAALHTKYRKMPKPTTYQKVDAVLKELQIDLDGMETIPSDSKTRGPVWQEWYGRRSILVRTKREMQALRDELRLAHLETLVAKHGLEA